MREPRDVHDLACGTGTLALMVKAQVPGAEVIGVDGDPAILAIAAAKARAAGALVQLDHGLSDNLRSAAGFVGFQEGERLRTPLGTIALYRGERPC